MRHYPGYVYVLSNPEMPGVVKVGRTVNDPARRARQLRTTGVPGRFKVAYSAWSQDCVGAEAVAHRLLSATRVSRDREFFRIGERRAAAVVAGACGKRRGLPNLLLALVVLLVLGVAWMASPSIPGIQAFLHAAL